MLVADDLPELGADLVAALARLNVHDLPHLVNGFCSILEVVRDELAD